MRQCRCCGYPKMTPFLDLGFTPPADRFLASDQLNDPEIYYPLVVVRCDHCMLIQLSYVVPPEILYQENYPYESSLTKTGCEHFDLFAASTIEEFSLKKDELACDIGSNVGVLLSGFKKRGMRVLGFDPAKNIAQIAEKNGIPTISEFFNISTARDAAAKYGRAKVITGSNVFAHIDGLVLLMKAVDILLEEDGIFIIEAPYLVHLLSNLEYDTIYHEHLSYLSLTPLVPFFQKCGFELFNVKQVDIHGGSIRLFVNRAEMRPVQKNVNELLAAEEKQKIHSINTLNAFAQRVSKNRYDIQTLLRDLKNQGKRIAAVSAPAKGMTLLNYCKIDSEYLEFVTEKSLLKVDRYTPGTHLLVKSDAAIVTEKIDYALLLAWNFKDEIMKNLSEFKKRGGKFIVPIPTPIVV